MKVGDIVSYPRKYLPKWQGDDFAGDTYGVCFEGEGSGIEFFEGVGGHNGGRLGALKDRHCWFCNAAHVKIIEECP